MQTLICTYDHESGTLSPITTITPNSILAITEVRRVSSYNGEQYTAGWNLTADGRLIETYEEAQEVEAIRRLIVKNVRANARLIIV